MSELYIPPERFERDLITGRFLKGCISRNKGRKMVYHSKRSKARSIKNLSKGRGALIKAIHRSCPSVTVECYELMPENREFLHTLDNVILLDEDFTKDSVGHYTKIIANPPFSGNQDIDHVRLMYERLEEGGILAAITSQHWKFASEKKCVEFREWLEKVHGEVFEISAGEFKESGTSISTMAVVIKK